VEIGFFTEFEWRPGVDEAQAFDDSLTQMTVAEDLGYDAVWLAELHFQKERSVLSSPLVVGATIAGRTKHVKIGFAVQVLPLIHPLRLAEDVATLDHVSRDDFRRGTKRPSRPLHGLQHPLRRSRERFDETLNPPNVDGGAVHVRRLVLSSTTSARSPSRTRSRTHSGSRRRRKGMRRSDAVAAADLLAVGTSSVSELELRQRLPAAWRETGHPDAARSA
jgi:hypothetical protein